MSDAETLKTSFERVKKLLTLKPEKGQYTTTTNVRVQNGTTCQISHKYWTFTADIGQTEGGNDAGPGPGILQRGAIGSCLAIGYAKWAAWLDVPIESIEVDVHAEVDARGSYGIDGVSPAHKQMCYTVRIKSSAPKERVREVIEKADAHSPILMDIKQPVPVEREVEILKDKSAKSENAKV